MTEETKNKLFYIADRLDADYKNGDDKDKYSIGKRDGVFMVLYAFDLMDDFKAWQESK